jgi:hypothetical protein
MLANRKFQPEFIFIACFGLAVLRYVSHLATKITDERHPVTPESQPDVRAAHSVHRFVSGPFIIPSFAGHAVAPPLSI